MFQEDVNLIKNMCFSYAAVFCSIQNLLAEKLETTLSHDFLKNISHHSKPVVNHNHFYSSGISTLSSCGNPQTLQSLPELPPGDEHRLQKAALNLQQKLILREWLKENRLQSYYSRFANFLLLTLTWKIKLRVF